MSNAITTIDPTQLPSTQVGNDEAFQDLARGSTFLSRLQLYTKGEAINDRKIAPGQYGIPENKDEITVLGDSVDVLVLAKRPKAMDLSDKDAIVESYDPTSEEFKRIQATSEERDSGCMYGVEFLVYERTTGRFLSFYCGTKTSRSEAGKIYPFCPLTQADIDAKAAAGQDVSGLSPRGPQAMTLKSRTIKKGTWSWHAPVVLPCSTPIKPPAITAITEQIVKFLNPQPQVEKVVEAPKGRRAR